jgi:hypothetical protein
MFRFDDKVDKAKAGHSIEYSSYSLILKMELVRTLETSVNFYQTTQRIFQWRTCNISQNMLLYIIRLANN